MSRHPGGPLSTDSYTCAELTSPRSHGDALCSRPWIPEHVRMLARDSMVGAVGVRNSESSLLLLVHQLLPCL